MPRKNFSDFLDSIGSFFGSGDGLPWTDGHIIARLEREVAEDGAGVSRASDDRGSLLKLSWALVHSKRPSDVQRGIAMLEVPLNSGGTTFEIREILYLLAVGYFRANDYAKSRRFIDQALQITPDFTQALALKKMIEHKITKDGVIGIGIAVTAVGIVSGLAAALARKR